MCESSSRTLDEQLDRVLALRDAALQLLQRDGEWMEVEGYPGRVRSFESDSIMMLHRTPFQPATVVRSRHGSRHHGRAAD